MKLLFILTSTAILARINCENPIKFLDEETPRIRLRTFAIYSAVYVYEPFLVNKIFYLIQPNDGYILGIFDLNKPLEESASYKNH